MFVMRGEVWERGYTRVIRPEEDLHVWRAKPGVFGVGDNHGLVLMGAEHPWVPTV